MKFIYMGGGGKKKKKEKKWVNTLLGMKTKKVNFMLIIQKSTNLYKMPRLTTTCH